MRVLIDTDVLLDVALNRTPHVQSSAGVLRWVESGGKGAIAWHSLTNCAYLLKGGGRPFIEGLLRIVEVAPAHTGAARRALRIPISDLEDAFQVAAAMEWKADAVVTRNVTDYRKSPVPALTPSAFLLKAAAQ